MKRPDLQPNDIHLVLNARSRRLKCFDAGGRLKWAVPARGEGVSGPGWTVPNGDTPPGLYRCGHVLRTRADEPPGIWASFGPAFVFLVDEEERARGGHTGVGIHGGRDSTPGRSVEHGGQLMVTHGCVRVDDDDLMALVVPAIEWTQRHGGTAWLTVSWE